MSRPAKINRIDAYPNIRCRFTAGGGVGGYRIDRSKAEGLVAGGPAGQSIRLDSVEVGAYEERRLLPRPPAGREILDSSWRAPMVSTPNPLRL